MSFNVERPGFRSQKIKKLKNIENGRYTWDIIDIIDMETKLKYQKEVTRTMSLCQKLKQSGNPQAAVQTVIPLLESHSPKEVANIMCISIRWVHELKKHYINSNQNIKARILKRWHKSSMPKELLNILKISLLA